MSEPIVKISELRFTYPEGSIPALDGVELEIEKGAFWVLCGCSGCGKTTLLRQLKPDLSPHGTREGEIWLFGAAAEALSQRDRVARIGFVQQSPESQIVTDTVWHELAFGLESLGCDSQTIRTRVAEMASFFGMESWFHRETASLSGGQKQLLNLAAVMTLSPEILVLDEPTAALDPIAASNFLAVLGRIHRELGTTVILTEHRLEEVFAMATCVAVMERGRILCTGSPTQVGEQLRRQGHTMYAAMPAAMRIWSNADGEGACPVTVPEGQRWLRDFAACRCLHPVPPEIYSACSNEAILQAKEVWFGYPRGAADVLRDFSLSVYRGEILALLGGNGAGKTTALKLLGGLLSPQNGRVHRDACVGYLPQEVRALFLKKTVQLDLEEAFDGSDLSAEERTQRLQRVVLLCGLSDLLERCPYDLSGGEQRRAALAKILLREPEILLLDEPTAGVDAAFQERFGTLLQTLAGNGVAVVMVSHNVEFCAAFAHRCAMLFDGAVLTEGSCRSFFAENRFYTTTARRIAHDLIPEAVTVDDVILACGGEIPPEKEIEASALQLPLYAPQKEEKKRPLRRHLAALGVGASALLCWFFCIRGNHLSALVSSGGLTQAGWRKLPWYALLIALLAALALLLRNPQKREAARAPRRPCTARAAVRVGCILLLIPLTLFLGTRFLSERRYFITSLLILMECMAPFFLLFEERRARARELVIVAMLCAIGVAGRAVLCMVPFFKPMLALAIIAGVALGGEAGFLVGAVTMLVSNMIFSQGPWTPWQMFAMGIVGFLAGVIFRKGWSRGVLSVFGALSAIVLYGGLMNLSSALTWCPHLTAESVLAYCVAGFPMDCVHAAATAIFLWLGAEPMIEKLRRVQKKYGMAE